ncbi:MAG: SH3 domain-containing protein [Proteobacteria bacterium]|nr:SH3 domain-containing protein [Pseudomonadota bacterium]MBU1058314.1 SH3 domain-containing protein [Pseudomonadota bacterium]
MNKLPLKLRLILPLIVILFLVVTSSASAKMGSIKGDKVQLRSGPGTNYSVKWEYGNGIPLKILSEKGAWIKVKDFEDDSGWIFNEYVDSTPHMIVKVNKGQQTKINIRSGPGVGYKIVGKAYYGVVFETLAQEKGWVKIKHESGLIGWIKRSLLWGF